MIAYGLLAMHIILMIEFEYSSFSLHFCDA